jgi:transposase-like protein
MYKYITDVGDGPAPEILQSLDELAREGARRMIAAALELEVDAYLEQLRDARDEKGRALVVRNGRARERKVTVGAGTIAIRAPRVHDRRPGQRFTSKILPPYMRRSPAVDEALPALYLRGLSTGDFSEGLAALVGPEGAALSAATITRLLQTWQAEYETWRQRSLVGTDYVYVWADGLYFNVRLEEDQLACLVLMGVRTDGKKEVIAIEDGYRESTESWASLLRDLKRRGMPAPVLAVGDGALGFWAALRQVYPETQEQRCWVHKIANVLDKLPKRLQARAKELLHEIMEAPDRKEAQQGMKRFAAEFEAKYPKAAACLAKDAETLLTFYDFPAEHWRHLRTTNPIESPFAGVRIRARQTKGAGSRKAGLAMAFKLALKAEGHWRKVNAPHLVALVRAGARFRDGVHVVTPAAYERQVDGSREGIAA